MTRDQMPRGTIVLVVGPSGSGKDSIIGGAAAALDGDKRFFFPRRDITRPAALGHEPYRALSLEAFEQRRARGAYSLSWPAHGLWYGVPGIVEKHLEEGRHVVVNVSRGVIPEARQRLQPARIVSIQVPRDSLRTRLQARNRESEKEIEARLERAAAFHIDGPDVVRLPNDSSLQAAVGTFVALLESLNQAEESVLAR